MYAQLGNIVFNGLRGFDTFQSTRESNLAQHAVIDGKPKLQRIGTNLEQVTLSIQFHASFCNPETEYSALDSAREAGEILPLLLGSGEFVGNFAIQSIGKDIEELDHVGNIKNLRVQVSLIEAVVTDALASAALGAVLSGIGNAANGAARVVASPKAISEASQITKPLTRAKALAATVGNQIAKAKAVASQANHYARRAQEGLKTMRDALEQSNKAITEAKQIYSSAARVKDAIADTQGSLSATLVALESGNIDGALVANRELSNSVSRINGASSEIVNITATRRR
jgi:phage protein U